MANLTKLSELNDLKSKTGSVISERSHRIDAPVWWTKPFRGASFTADAWLKSLFTIDLTPEILPKELRLYKWLRNHKLFLP